MNTVFQKDKIGLGKRKRAVARVFFVPGNGKVTINKVSGEKYLQYNTNYLNAIWSPLEKLNLKIIKFHMRNSLKWLMLKIN